MYQTQNKRKPRKHQQYDLAFRRSAAEHWLSSGKSGEVVAAKLGISGQTLKIWKQQLSVTRPPGGALTFEQLQEKNRRLRANCSVPSGAARF